MTAWKEICRVEDIPVLGSRRVARDQGLDVAVFRNDADEVFALLDRCPHKGGPLSQGIVFGTSVACPMHNWTIGLKDGSPQYRTTNQFLKVLGLKNISELPPIKKLKSLVNQAEGNPENNNATQNNAS